MTPERFEHLLSIVGPFITHHCRSRRPISASERLCLCLTYLATVETQSSLSFSFRIGRSTISGIISETCSAIWTALKSHYMRSSQSSKDWENIAREFEGKWNLPNSLGALDGKHVCIKCPKNARSAYYNYKNFHSMALLGICDAKYCFSLVDIGCFGRDNDAALLSESVLGKMFASGPEAFGVPEPRTVENYNLPYVLVGDEIFPLKPWLMTPFPGRGLVDFQRIYNYRL